MLIDQSGLDPATAAGGLRAKVMQLLMFAAFHEPIQEALNLAAQLLAQVPESGGVNYVRVFVRYVFATQERRRVVNFAKAVDEYRAEKGDNVMTFAEEVLREGEVKGEIKTISQLLKVGVTWETIERATRINPQQFEEMQKELARLAAADSGGALLSDTQ